MLLSASGKALSRRRWRERFAGLERMVLLCGRYEGVDERVAEHLATDELSIGDFVLSGGELAAALVIDAVTRLLPGALGNEASSLHESFSLPRAAPSAACRRVERHDKPESEIPHDTLRSAADGARATLDYPHYTRPADFRGWAVSRGAAERKSRRDSALAPAGSAGQNAAQSPRPARRRQKRICSRLTRRSPQRRIWPVQYPRVSL